MGQVPAAVYPNFFEVTTVTSSLSLDTTYNAKYIRCNSVFPITLTVRQVSEIDWLTDSEFMVEQMGTGQVTIGAGTNVTINTPLTLKTREQYSVIALQYNGSNVWTIFGDLAL